LVIRPSGRERVCEKNGPDGAFSRAADACRRTVCTSVGHFPLPADPLPADTDLAPARDGASDGNPQLPQNMSPDSMAA
jgi:hypothetical protein